ncbi:MAG: phosphate acetyltransferase [Candidatus Omnitrophota bacterium]
MSLSRLDLLREKAKSDLKRIVLPEGDDARVLEAAVKISRDGIAKITVLGDTEEVLTLAESSSLDIKSSGVQLVNPVSCGMTDEIARTFYDLRKHKGISPDEARKTVLENRVFYGALMTRLGDADGFVAGASHKTADVARASIYCLEIDPNAGVVSSAFVIGLDDCQYGEGGLFVYGDCAVIPDPNPDQLACIAISCGLLMERLFDVKARVALLSYSTKGSARGNSIDKVRSALQIVKSKAPGLAADGELQADAAIVPEVADIKARGSNVAGMANVLIFPNLDSGNICYKITQRLGKARVVGPMIQGCLQPASDLSRGCGVEEIIDAVTVTAVRAQANK